MTPLRVLAQQAADSASTEAVGAAGAVTTRVAQAGAGVYRCRLKLGSKALATLQRRLGSMMPLATETVDGFVELQVSGYRLGDLCMPLDAARLARLGDQLEGQGLARGVIAATDVVNAGGELVVFPQEGHRRWSMLVTALERRAQVGADRTTSPAVDGKPAGTRAQVVHSL